VGDAEAAVRRAAEGWQFIAVSSELGFMLEASGRAVTVATGQGNGSTARY